MKYLKTFENYPIKHVDFIDLIGNHILSGVDRATTTKLLYSGFGYEDAAVLRFVLDGKTYEAAENPEDGYRSSLGYLVESDEKVSNLFYPHEVIGKLGDMYRDNSDVLEFYDVSTKELVLAVGTNNNDDYYPSCIMEWYPENLELNRAANKYNL